MALVAGRNFRTQKGIGIIEPFAFLSAHPSMKGLVMTDTETPQCKNPTVGSLLVSGTIYLYLIRLWKRGCLILLASYSSLLCY